MKPVEIQTMGCRLNAYESEVMRGLAEKAGLGDLVVINSCAVTGEAERQTRQAIRRARRDNPAGRIVVTGCAAQINADGFAKMPEVDAIIGNIEKLDPDCWSGLANGGSSARIQVNDIMSVRETAGHMIQGFDGRARAFVEVQQGCDHRCTFCIIPFGRGPSRSVPAGEIVSQIRLLTEKGFNEVVLTGVDLTDYGKDLPGTPRLGDLVARILKLVPELKRLRLSSLDPVEIDDRLIGLFGDEPRLLPWVHLSVQAGDDMVLKRMKRRHLRDDVLKICDRLRAQRSDMTFGADLIAGFPTETEAMFENTRALVREAGLSHLHVFPYSPRAGTPAERMPQIPPADRKRRAALLRKEGAARMHALLDAGIGSEISVLMEKDGMGHCERFLPVRMGEAFAPGTMVRARVTARAGDVWTAERAA